MGGGFGNAALGGTHGGFFMKNSLEYISPNVAGFQLYALTTLKNGADAGYVKADGTANNGGGTITANTEYTSLALSGQIAGANIWLANQDMKNTFKSWTIGASYQLLDQLNVSANYIDHKDDGSDPVKSYAVGATYKLTPAVSLVGQYAHNDLAKAQGLWNAGMKYDFSKRTAAYITYGHADNGAISTIGDRGSYKGDGTVTTSNNSTVVGLVHAF
jgi:predicted porin